jgi:hypothetical protein
MIKTGNAEQVERMEATINAYRFLFGKSEGKRLFGTAQHKFHPRTGHEGSDGE